MKNRYIKNAVSIMMITIIFVLSHYDSISQTTSLIPYLKGKAWGFCDFNKKIIIEPQYDYVSAFSEGYAVVKAGDKYGMIEPSGKEIIPIKYIYVLEFSEGISLVQDGDNYGGFDKNGKLVIPFSQYYFKGYQDGVLIADSSYVYGLINIKGERVTEFKFGSAERFSGNLIKVLYDGALGLIDNTGKEILPIKYQAIDYCYMGYSRIKLDKEWGFIDSTGKITIEPKFSEVGYFNASWTAPYKSVDKWGLIDIKGKFITEPLYDEIGEGNDFGFFFNTFSSKANNMIKAKMNGKVGFIDREGKVIVPFKYELTGFWNEGYCPVYVGGESPLRLTVINSKGEELFPPTNKYNYVGEYSEGLISVGISGYKQSIGFIDINGKEIIPLQFEKAGKFINGIAIVMKNGLYGLIDKQGREITQFKYKELERSNNIPDVFTVKFRGENCYINSKGVEYFE